MKKTNKLWLALLLSVLVAALLAVGFTAAAEDPTVVDQGYCGGEGDGTNLMWVLTSDNTLTVSDDGEMMDRFSSNPAPWYSRCSDVQTVVI
jgi:hypothetical protein